ncbi:hypothetical protein L596_013547 [Steinernema carpocapsae]|uniref:Uncharacterized protein n=1 Tax=Steinernema carpocapsae TaxID=34508 RepID=A0A4U5P0H4_STECR|nr:hypothetical protein L596_013547 [Steinernema carpocapsae]
MIRTAAVVYTDCSNAERSVCLINAQMQTRLVAIEPNNMIRYFGVWNKQEVQKKIFQTIHVDSYFKI